MSGALRAIAYRVAAHTGFRVDELRSLAPESFHLDGPRPFIRLAASSAKNRKPVDQPVPSSLVGPSLSTGLANIWSGNRCSLSITTPAKRSDATWKPPAFRTRPRRCFADFHALRVYYVSGISAFRPVDQGGPTTCQTFQARDHIQALRQGLGSRPVWRLVVVFRARKVSRWGKWHACLWP